MANKPTAWKLKTIVGMSVILWSGTALASQSVINQVTAACAGKTLVVDVNDCATCHGPGFNTTNPSNMYWMDAASGLYDSFCPDPVATTDPTPTPDPTPVVDPTPTTDPGTGTGMDDGMDDGWGEDDMTSDDGFDSGQTAKGGRGRSYRDDPLGDDPFADDGEDDAYTGGDTSGGGSTSSGGDSGQGDRKNDRGDNGKHLGQFK